MNFSDLLSKLYFGVILSNGKTLLYKGTMYEEKSEIVHKSDDFDFILKYERFDENTLIFQLRVKNKKRVRLRDIIVVQFDIDGDYTFLKNRYQSWGFTRPISTKKKEKKLSIPFFTEIARTVHYYRTDEPENTAQYFTAVKGKGYEHVLGFITFEHYHPYFLLETGKITALNAIDDLDREEIISEKLMIVLNTDWINGFKKIMNQLPKRSKKGVYGWCSWYYFYTKIDEKKITEVLKELRKYGIPVQIFQVDDGYQRAIGDWLEFNEKFRGSLKDLASTIKSYGYTPGLWLAPFIVTLNSKIFKEHKDWLVRDEKGNFVKVLINPNWEGRNVYALDLTNEQVIEFIRDVFKKLVEAGFTYLKLDFLYGGIVKGVRVNNNMTRVEVYRNALKVIREVVGDDAYLLGCGAPIGESIGFFDGMRIGPDTQIKWKGSLGERLLRKLFGFWSVISMRDAIINTIHRWMLNDVWNNDPDVLILRKGVTEGMIRIQAVTFFLLSKHIMFSDPLKLMLKYGMEAYLKAIPPIEAPGHPLDYYEEMPHILLAKSNEFYLLGLINITDNHKYLTIKLSDLGITNSAKVIIYDFWNDHFIDEEKELSLVIPPRDAKLIIIKEVGDKRPEIIATNLDMGQRVFLTKNEKGFILSAKLPGKREGKIYIRVDRDSSFRIKANKGKVKFEKEDDILVMNVNFVDELEVNFDIYI